MNIREALITDAGKIKELVSSLSHFYLENKGSSLPEWFLQTLDIFEFERRISSEEFDNFVYLIDGEIVGYISIKENSHLYHLFVDESYQGNGISKKLWRYATTDSLENIYTVRSSMFAVPVYKKFGFIESGLAASKDGISFQPMELKC